MMVPLLYQAELIGTLNLSATKAGVFSPEHQEVAQQIANQLAIAIGQANLYHQVQRHAQEMEQRVTDRTRELSTLYEVAAVASQALELPTMLAQVLRQVLTTVRSDVGLIWLNDNQADQPFHLAAQQGLSRAEVDQVEAEIHRQGWLNRVMAQNQPLFLLELTSVSSLFQSNFQVALQSFLGLPIRATGHLLGVLTIFGQRAKQFNLEDIALLNTVADQIGVAIENIRLRQQAREAAIMAERERMARDLHDSVTQSLYSLSLFVASALEEANHGHLEPVQHYLTRMGETTQQALKEMRLMIYQLRPTDLERLGLVGALHQRLATVERRSGITARLIAEELIELPLAVEQELYRITQEALNNILKHAQATQVIIHLRRLATEVELTIHDNGQGFNPDEVETRGGLGLQGIRERVKVINGILAIRSTPAIGTTIEVRVKVL
jgi:signal transduction histidine kinase